MPKCELCWRDVDDTTQHHLIPRTMHRNSRVRRDFRVIKRKTKCLCYPCHKKLHKTFNPKQLAFEYNTIEKLKENREIINWIKWIKSKPPGFNPD